MRVAFRQANPNASQCTSPRLALHNHHIQHPVDEGNPHHGQSGGATVEHRNPAIGDTEAYHGRHEGNRIITAVAPRQHPEEQHRQPQRDDLIDIVPERSPPQNNPCRVEERERTIVGSPERTLCIPANIEFIGVNEQRGMAFEGLGRQPELVEKLQMVAWHHGSDPALFHIQGSTDDTPRHEAGGRPGKESPERQSDQERGDQSFHQHHVQPPCHIRPSHSNKKGGNLCDFPRGTCYGIWQLDNQPEERTP